MAGGHAWRGGGHAWWAACMTGAWQGEACMAGGMCGGGGACMAGETVTAADGTHSTGMHSCNTEMLFWNVFTKLAKCWVYTTFVKWYSHRSIWIVISMNPCWRKSTISNVYSPNTRTNWWCSISVPNSNVQHKIAQITVLFVKYWTIGTALFSGYCDKRTQLQTSI